MRRSTSSWRIVARAASGSSVRATGTAGDDVEAVERLAGPLAALGHRGDDDVADVVGVAEPEHHPVADLAGQAEHVRREGGDVDRQVGPRGVAHELELGVEELALGRRLAAEDRPHDARVLAHLGHRLFDLRAVPVLDRDLV